MKKSKLFRTLTLAVAAALCMATTTVTAYAGALTLTRCRCRKPPRPPQKCRRKPKNPPPAAWSRRAYLSPRRATLRWWMIFRG